MYPQSITVEHKTSPTGRYQLSDFHIQFADAAYPDAPERSAALKTALASRVAGPAGSEWWGGLANWQKSRVRRYRQHRSATHQCFATAKGPEWRKPGAEGSDIDAITARAIEVIKDVLMNRGRFFRDPNGAFTFGGPPTDATARTLAKLADVELAARVKEVATSVGLVAEPPPAQQTGEAR